MRYEPLSTYNDPECAPVRTAYAVTAGRVEYYADVVDMMARLAIQRYKTAHKQNPSADQVTALTQNLARKLIIQRDILGAHKIDIE